MKASTRPRPYLYLSEPLENLVADFRTWPSHALMGHNRRYFWQGAGPLSIKMFVGGAARYQVGRTGECRVDDDCYLVLNHDQTYTITIDSPAPVHSFCLFFSQELAGQVFHAASTDTGRLLDEPVDHVTCPAFFECTYRHDDILTPRLIALRSALQHLGAEEPCPLWLSQQMHGVMEGLLARNGLVRQEIDRLQAAAISRPATREELFRRLHMARDYIQACFDSPLTLDEMARIACLSPNHFLRTFRAVFYTTPHQYLTERRLQEACRLLERTDLSITEVCLRVGFHSLGSFSALFAQRIGISPEKFRRQRAGTILR